LEEQATPGLGRNPDRLNAGIPFGFVAYAQKLFSFQSSQNHSICAGLPDIDDGYVHGALISLKRKSPLAPYVAARMNTWRSCAWPAATLA
jgi:hypothetical protein